MGRNRSVFPVGDEGRFGNKSICPRTVHVDIRVSWCRNRYQQTDSSRIGQSRLIFFPKFVWLQNSPIQISRNMSHIETDLIHAGKSFNDTKAVVPPIYQSATYYASSDAEAYMAAATDARYPYFYHRHGNPVGSPTAEVVAKPDRKRVV